MMISTQEPENNSGTEGNNRRNTNIKSRLWCFTLNNYTESDVKYLTEQLSQELYVIGREKGESGTPHLQGVIKFANPRSFGGMKKICHYAHWEVCKNWNASIIYCKKEDDYETNIKPSMSEQYDNYMISVYSNVEWKTWQQNILNLLITKPDNRTINWYWEPLGNIGKTFLTKYIDWKFKTIVTGGKQADIFNGIKTYLEEIGYPEVIIIDIPRTCEEYISYGALEKLKDGLFYSGKYEGGRCRLLPCHIIAFANFQPKTETMSHDRWKINLLS